MVTPAREARREDRRDAILDVAHECFVAEGYGATSMSTIAARLGGSKGTLYNYFKSKEELFDAFVRRTCARLLSQSEELPHGADLREVLLARANNFLNHVLSPDAIAIHRLVVGEGGRFPELARLFNEAGPKVGNARNARFFQQLMDDGVLRRADPVQAAQQFKGLILSGVYIDRLWGLIEDPSPEDRRRHAQAAVDTFLWAYAAKR